ncbi:alpha-ketoglutarate-dependent dioxygenase AlkB [Microcoleus asticus]|uniref:Alpha-ketoglutarate-dependent dioxygenase AlkB n=1 Tax=Microcoleus asticus IPMA8 TaxID=2563858 RepID=A0ABX2D6P2_9CYAN|nr:alpha-ketoglutarate-dependent dioxygenase AlkB [Microcoleus asticus]NQE38146.1 Alpha-ketoglutarate-dependent dioxygenase AlkB [Microcoleus asticus IPMA8]
MLHLKSYFSVSEQQNLVEITRNIAKVNGGMIIPVMATGQKFNCSQTSCGIVGWLSDRTGYRYSKINPVNNQPFAAMPTELIDIAQSLAKLVGEFDYQPETCLINFYPANIKSKLGLHQDNTEQNLKPCIISISIGDDCSFVIGSNRSRTDPLKGIILRSGDALILHGDSRLAYHGVQRIIPKTSNLLKNNGRLNLTIRQVY